MCRERGAIAIFASVNDIHLNTGETSSENVEVLISLVNRADGFSKCLNAISIGKVVYDPGYRIDDASSSTPRVKARSQFRIAAPDLPLLYESFTSLKI